MSRFNFVGKLGFNKDGSGNPWLREGKTKANIPYQTLGAYVLADNNRGYIELFGMSDKIIKTFNNEGVRVEINAEDRFDQNVIDSVRNKQIIRDDDRHEFIMPWDFIEYVKEHKEELEGKIVSVTGNVQKNIYNGKISDRFQIRNLYVTAEDTKPSLTVTEEVFWTKDSIDTTDWKQEKKIYINGYVDSYIDKDTGNKLVPKQLVFDCSKIDFENEKHMKLLQFKLKQMGLKYEDGKIVNNLKNKKVYKLIFIENYVNGAELVEFDESCLTENQKMAIELGASTIDDFRPKGSIYGNRVTMFKIINFDLTGDYSDGCIDAEISEKEFEDMIYVAPVAEESAEEALEEVKEEKKSEEEDDDLFS